MKIKIYNKTETELEITKEQLQTVLDKFTMNCGWNTSMLTIDDKNVIVVDTFNNYHMSPVLAMLLLLCAQYPEVFSVEVNKPVIPIPIFTVGNKTNDEYSISYPSKEGEVTIFVKANNKEAAERIAIKEFDEENVLPQISFSILIGRKFEAINILLNSNIEIDSNIIHEC